MSLKFDIEKDKSIAMMVETSGIDDVNTLDFTFNITVNDIKYGFPCKMDEGKVVICIPALNEVIKDLKAGKYVATLDVTGDKNYFLQPYNEEVELTVEPKVGVVVADTDREDIKEAFKASISKIVEIDAETTEKVVVEDISIGEGKEKTEPVKSVVNKMFK